MLHCIRRRVRAESNQSGSALTPSMHFLHMSVSNQCSMLTSVHIWLLLRVCSASYIRRRCKGRIQSIWFCPYGITEYAVLHTYILVGVRAESYNTNQIDWFCPYTEYAVLHTYVGVRAESNQSGSGITEYAVLHTYVGESR